jgi:hypothetical protein
MVLYPQRPEQCRLKAPMLLQWLAPVLVDHFVVVHQLAVDAQHDPQESAANSIRLRSTLVAWRA